uniref:C2H2-type domain-containing protein n=1 Tax=Panagrellus redivivus TaxID=6233 RepID=A0A7E4ZT93_PANRE
MSALVRNDEILKRAPSIIPQRKRQNSPRNGARSAIGDDLLQQEIDRDLSSELSVQDGVLVANKNRLTGEGLNPTTSRRVVVVNTTEVKASLRSRQLPGIADEVESYPCRICNRVFLTDNGLSKHAENEHPRHINLIANDIASITSEWKRRSASTSNKQYVRVHPQKLAFAMRRNNTGRPKSPGVYELCNICDTIIKLDPPDAFEKHKAKHAEDARNEGDMNLTCVQCNTKFSTLATFEKHLMSHSASQWVCEFCKSGFASEKELLLHRNEYHATLAAEPSASRPSTSTEIHNNQSYDQGNYIRNKQNLRLTELAQVKTKCALCNMVFYRIDLLMRHVLTVHKTATFEAVIEVKGLPSYCLSVTETGTFFVCCQMSFTDHNAFTTHRMSAHEPTDFG